MYFVETMESLFLSEIPLFAAKILVWTDCEKAAVASRNDVHLCHVFPSGTKPIISCHKPPTRPRSKRFAPSGPFDNLAFKLDNDSIFDIYFIKSTLG